MTVAELIAELQKCNPNDLVILSRDQEGNYFDTLETVEEVCYDENGKFIGLKKLTKEDIEMGYTEEDVMGDGVDAVCLWP